MKLATGWLDWRFDEAMRADCCAILLAYQGKSDMLKAIYGSSEEPDLDDLPVLKPGMLGR